MPSGGGELGVADENRNRLDGAKGVYLSLHGSQVYTTGAFDHALDVFQRSP